MTLREFENRYWYATELRDYAVSIGIPGAKHLRKDELQKAVVAFLRTGKAVVPTARALRRSGVQDVERGLSLRRRIEHYTSNRETKDFIIEQARRLAPDVRPKSGVWYRLNRWREEQSAGGKRPTYGDLVRHFISLNRTPRFEQIQYDCYVNFLSDFHAANETATRAQALAAWKQLKTLDVPKNYRSWVKTNREGARRV
jgi:hypothetical protein